MSRERYRSKFVSHGQRLIIVSLCYGLTFMMNQKWKNKIYKLGNKFEFYN